MTEPITAEPLCRTRGCPEPASPDFHVCPCGAQNVEHHHIESRARAPGKKHSKANIMMLCTEHHRMVSENLAGAVVLPIEGVGRFWQILDLHGNTLFQRLVEPREESYGNIRNLYRGESRSLHRQSGSRLDNQAIPGEEVKVSAPQQGPGLLAVVEPRQAPAPQTGAMAPVLPTLADWERSASYGDDILALLSAQAHVRATGAYMWHCMAVARYQEAHRWSGDGWVVEARRLFGREATKLRDQAALFRRYLAWVEMAGEAQVENAAYISSPQLGVLERVTAEKFATSIESAINYVAETGDASARGLAGRLQAEGVLPKSTALYRCPSCGHVGLLSEFPKEEEQ